MKKLAFFLLVNMFWAFSLIQDLDAQCNPAGNGTNGGVLCMYPDTVANCLYVGGGFNTSGTDSINHCTYWNDTNYMPMSFNGLNGCNDSVWCFTYFNGSLYVGGNFTAAGGVPCNRIARWDGTAWHPVGNGFNNPVRSLCVFNNELYAGGAFSFSGTSPMQSIARWNGLTWSQVKGGTNGIVETMLVWNSDLYIGGSFTNAGGITCNRICKWEGTAYSPVGSGFSSGMMGQCVVKSLCIYNGNLIAGGNFEHAGSMEVHNIAMWNGSTWMSIGDIEGEMSGGNMVRAMCVYNGHLFVGGNFRNCGSSETNNLGVWNGFSWSGIGSGFNGRVQSLAVYYDYLYIAGSFTNAAGTPLNNIAKYSSTTGAVSPINETIKLELFPNPAQNVVYVDWLKNIPDSFNLTIFDVNGRIVIQQYYNGIAMDLLNVPLSTEQLDNGFYFLSIIARDQKYIARLVIQK